MMEHLDYEGVGFISGLEVHQQLGTTHKLFCRCPAGLYTEAHDGEVLRQAMACGTAMASLAIESFSPERLVETTPAEIQSRVSELHGMVHYDLFKMF